MYRVLSLCAIGLLGLAAGCSMCAHPFDECGPTYHGGDSAACCPTYRAGSILAGTASMHQAAAPAADGEAQPSLPVPNPAPVPAPEPTTKQWTPSAPHSTSPY